MTPGVLLDTHILLGVLAGKGHLGPATHRLLGKPEPIYFSPLSVAELRLKDSVRGTRLVSDTFADDLLGIGLEELALVSQAAADIARFPGLHHHDPFDRLLVAQAACHGLTLITADLAIQGLDLPFVHPAHL